jgi:hypothetical protein
MRGRGENPAPHFFCTRQAAPRLVGQFFWTIVQIFGPNQRRRRHPIFFSPPSRYRRELSLCRDEVKTSPRICFAPAKPLPDSLGSFFGRSSKFLVQTSAAGGILFLLTAFTLPARTQFMRGRGENLAPDLFCTRRSTLARGKMAGQISIILHQSVKRLCSASHRIDHRDNAAITIQTGVGRNICPYSRCQIRANLQVISETISACEGKRGVPTDHTNGKLGWLLSIKDNRLIGAWRVDAIIVHRTKCHLVAARLVGTECPTVNVIVPVLNN